MTHETASNITPEQRTEIRKAALDMISIADNLLRLGETFMNAFCSVHVVGTYVDIDFGDGFQIVLNYCPDEYIALMDYRHVRQIDVDEFEEIENWDDFSLKEFRFSISEWLYIAATGIGNNKYYYTIKLNGHGI